MMKAIIIASYYYFARKRQQQGGGGGTFPPLNSLRIQGKKVHNLRQHVCLIFLYYIANQHILIQLLYGKYMLVLNV